ncbi:MAG: F0F1 ATP synthase subunit A [Oligoflexia bacterium]|nr:F0F1 ATP synthase subunit A [Oligoflexia bacterium]
MTSILLGSLAGLVGALAPASLSQVEESAPFSWFELIPGVTDGRMMGTLGVTDHGGHVAVAVLGSWLVCAFLISLALLARLGLNKARLQGGTLQYVPGSGFSVRNLFEVYVSAMRNLGGTILDSHDARVFFPLFGGLFIYVFFCNLLGILPGMLPPTENISNNFAMASVVVVVYLVVALGRNGGAFLKHMAGPVWWLAPLIFAIELLGLLVIRPGSLSLRLMGNITGDHLVFGIMSDLTHVLIPSVFLGLGIFVSFLQAFVFTLLSMIYISMSVVHDDH